MVIKMHSLREDKLVMLHWWLMRVNCLNNKKGMKGVTCKLELENAYNLMNWDRLLNMLKMMNFGERWIKWIKACNSIASFLV